MNDITQINQGDAVSCVQLPPYLRRRLTVPVDFINENRGTVSGFVFHDFRGGEIIYAVLKFEDYPDLFVKVKLDFLTLRGASFKLAKNPPKAPELVALANDRNLLHG